MPALVAAWVATLGGLIEGILNLIRRDFLNRTLHLTRDAVWLPMVANLAFLLLPTLFILWLQRRRPTLPAVTYATGVSVAIVGSGLGLYWGRVHWASGLLIGLGLARVACKWVSTPANLFLTVVRRTTPYLVACALVVPAATIGPRVIRERKAHDSPAADPHRNPNVLLLVLDTARWWEFSLAGYHRPTTPEIDKLAARGRVFDNALSSSPWTLPGHATMLTGRWPIELGVDWRRPLDSRYPSIAEVLRELGYATGGFVANNTYCSYEHGLDRGFTYYRDYPLTPGIVLISSSIGRRLNSSRLLRRVTGYYQVLGRKDARNVNKEFLAWQGSLGERPFFAMLNYFDVHEPYLPPRGWDIYGDGGPRRLEELYHVTGMAALPFKEKRPAEQMRRERDAYDGALSYLDHEIGLLFQELERTGTLHHTLVFITADHGEHFGEHGLWEHGNSLYRGVIQVPLIVIWPDRIHPGPRIETPVSTRSIPVTILDALGLQSRAPFPGKSLLEHFGGSTDESSRSGPIFMDYFTEAGEPEQGVVMDRWQLYQMKDNQTRLFDFVQDPGELHDLRLEASVDSVRYSLTELADSIRIAAGGRPVRGRLPSKSGP